MVLLTISWSTVSSNATAGELSSVLLEMIAAISHNDEPPVKNTSTSLGYDFGNGAVLHNTFPPELLIIPPPKESLRIVRDDTSNNA